MSGDPKGLCLAGRAYALDEEGTRFNSIIFILETCYIAEDAKDEHSPKCPVLSITSNSGMLITGNMPVIHSSMLLTNI